MSSEYLLVDGYNIIFAWDDLKALAEESLDLARDRLGEILKNYQGIRGCNIILVFDAYLVKGNKGSIEKDGNIYVVYTKEAETADNYIEKTASSLAREGKYRVQVATSDYLEQVIIIGRGAVRISALELKGMIEAANKKIRQHIEAARPIKNNMLLDNLDEAAANWLEELRRKKQ